MNITQVKKFAIFESIDGGSPVWIATHENLEDAVKDQAERLADSQVEEGEVSYIQEVLHFTQAGE